MAKHPCSCGNLCDIRSDRCRSCFESQSDLLTEKLCRGCDKVHPIDAYNWRPNGRGGKKRRSRCKSCEARATREYLKDNPDKRKSAKRAWELNNPEKHARSLLRRAARNLGLDEEQVLAHFDSHNGRCEMCGRTAVEVTITHKRLSIDHCHISGRFRGVLCGNCNRGLGFFDDNPDLLRAGAIYLERFSVE